jgi:hypothetical protein
MRSVILNRNNIVPNTNNTTLVYNFPTSVDLTGARIAISNISMYYSWDNINITYANNRFTYQWRDAAPATTYTTYNVVIPDGLYEVRDLNAYLQFVFIANGHYLVNSVGQNVYYAELLVNPNRYAVQINTYPVPTSLPAGWSNPASMPFASDLFNPSISLPANFNDILGYAAGFTTDLNAGVGTNLSYLSSAAPQVQPNSSLLFALSGIDNKYATPNSIVYSLAPNVAIGELIVEKPAEFNWNKLMAGTYSQLRLQILSNTFQPITIRDPQMTIVLVIEDQESKVMDVGAHLNSASSINAMTSRSGVPQNANFNIGGSGLRR